MKANCKVGLEKSMNEFGMLLRHLPGNEAVIDELRSKFELAINESFEILGNKIHKTTFDIIPQEAT